MSETKGLWESAKPKIWPFVGGVVVGMVVIYSNYVPSSDLIASSPDRIIPASMGMAKGALNPDKLEVRVCNTDDDPDKAGKELVFVYDGKKQVGTVGEDGYIVIEPYEVEEMYTWRCS